MKKRNITIITHYYPPEVGGGSHRSAGFAEEFAALGMNVTVVAPFPSYLLPKGKAHIKFRLYEKEPHANVTVYRTFVIPGDRGNIIKRLLYYFSFTVSSTIFLFLKIQRIDILLAISPPMFTGITGVLARRFRSALFILDIGDLWPESAIQLKILKNRLVIRLSQKLEQWIYENSDIINLVTRRCLEQFPANHKNGTRLAYVPNFVDTCTIRKMARDPFLVEELGLKNKLVFGYAGNIGVAQGLDIIVQAAHLTRHMRDIVYVVIGDGVERARIARQINTAHLDNIVLLSPVGREDIVRYLMLMDVMIIPLVKNEIFKATVPSKLYESMAAEIPVILCVDGEARAIVEESNCGVCVEPGCADELADKVISFYNNRELMAHLGRNGRKIAEERFSRKKIVTQYFNDLITMAPAYAAPFLSILSLSLLF